MSIKKKVGVVVLVALMLLFIAFIFIWNGIILLNNPSKDEYPIRGVDVSSYQGDINWDILSSNNISFAFIKATEGSSFVDPCFEYNWSEAQETSLRIGAYHFFSFDSEGATQADNYIGTVPKIENMLPPVIDLEFYGDKEKSPPAKENVTQQLQILINELKEYYGLSPIIYATEKSYSTYLAGEFIDCDIWIRNVVSKPNLSDDRPWTFWQYTNRGRFSGYNGTEKFIDINVFNGTSEEFNQYAK